MKENGQSVFKTNQHLILENGIVLEEVRPYPTWIMKIQVLFNGLNLVNDRNLKYIGKRDKIGVST